MGLQKSLSTPFGGEATYWRVNHFIYFDDRSMIFRAELHGFADKSRSDNNYQPARKLQISVEGDEFHNTVCSGAAVNDARDWVYNAILARDKTQAIIDYNDELTAIMAIPEASRTDEQINRSSELEALIYDAETNPAYIFNGATSVIE